MESNNMFEQIFENQTIFTIKDIHDVIWFKAKDVCNILEYKNTKQAIIYNVSEQDKTTWNKMKTKGLKFRPLRIHSQMIFINESGVNSLIMKSKKPNAKNFQYWITSEVIPQLRKHGFYVHKEHKPSALLHDDGYVYYSDKSCVNDEITEKFLSQPKFFKDKTDIKHKDTIIKLMKRANDIWFWDYEDEQVIYLYLTSIKNINDNRMICKVGYTNNIVDRHISLQDEYKAQFKIIGIKKCNKISDEKRFHRMYSKYFNGSQYKCKIETKSKDELYYYDDNLINFFDRFTIGPGCMECESHKLSKDIIFINNQNLKRDNWLLNQKCKLYEDKEQVLKDKTKFNMYCHEIDKYI